MSLKSLVSLNRDYIAIPYFLKKNVDLGVELKGSCSPSDHCTGSVTSPGSTMSSLDGVLGCVWSMKELELYGSIPTAKSHLTSLPEMSETR